MNAEISPRMKMLAENFEQSALAWNGTTAKAEVLVAKPRAGFSEEDICLTYGAVSTINFPLGQQRCANSRSPDSLSEIHLPPKRLITVNFT